MYSVIQLTPGTSGFIQVTVNTTNPVAYSPDMGTFPPAPIAGADEIDVVVSVAGINCQSNTNTPAPNFTIAFWSSLNTSGSDDLVPNMPAGAPNVGQTAGTWVCVGLIQVTASSPSGSGPYNYTYGNKSILAGTFTSESGSPLLASLRWSVHFLGAPSSAPPNYFAFQGNLNIQAVAKRKNF